MSFCHHGVGISLFQSLRGVLGGTWMNCPSGRYGMRVVSWDNAKPGDFVTFNWDGGVPDHIGMLVERYSDSAKCVEGNTSPTNAGSQSNGGGVYVRNRDRSQIQAIIRWT